MRVAGGNYLKAAAALFCPSTNQVGAVSSVVKLPSVCLRGGFRPCSAVLEPEKVRSYYAFTSATTRLG